MQHTALSPQQIKAILPKGPPKCGACRDSGLVQRNAEETRTAGEWLPLREMMRVYRACPFCRLGEQERELRKQVREVFG